MSFRIAPGVRIRTSSRGVRASIGPRVARVHVGSGRTTVSSGVGPFTAWSGTGPHRSAEQAVLRRTAAEVDRTDSIAAEVRVERSLRTMHLETFPLAERYVVPQPVRPDPAPYITARTNDALRGVSFFARKERKALKLTASAAGQSDALLAWQRAQNQQSAAQAESDAHWAALTSHDSAAVHHALEHAFEDNQSPAACVDVGTHDGVRFAAVVIIFRSADLMPDRRPSYTPSGAPTLHKRTKTERNELYSAALGSTVLAVAKESFASAPSVDEIKVLVIKKDTQAPNAASYLEAIYAGEYSRTFCAQLPWSTIDPAETLLQVPQAQLRRKGSAHDIVGLTLEDEPGLSSIVTAVRDALSSRNS